MIAALEDHGEVFPGKNSTYSNSFFPNSTYSNSFFPKTARDWDRLPSIVAPAATLAFRSLLSGWPSPSVHYCTWFLTDDSISLYIVPRACWCHHTALPRRVNYGLQRSRLITGRRRRRRRRRRRNLHFTTFALINGWCWVHIWDSEWQNLQ